MEGDRADGRRDAPGSGHFPVAGAVTQFVRAVDAAFGQGLGHFAVDQVDRAVDRAAAVTDRGRAALDLDRVEQERIGHDRVVGGDGGDVEQVGPVGQDRDPRHRLPANDGARGAGAEIVHVHARQPVQRFAQRAAPAVGQFVARQDLDRQRLGRLVAAERTAGDDDIGARGAGPGGSGGRFFSRFFSRIRVRIFGRVRGQGARRGKQRDRGGRGQPAPACGGGNRECHAVGNPLSVGRPRGERALRPARAR